MASRSSSSGIWEMLRANSWASTAVASIDCPPLLMSANPRPGDRPGDHEALDLGRALEDRVDLRVAMHPLDRVLARVSVAAEDLHRPLRRPDGHLAGLQLGHRSLGVLEVLAGAPHPGGPPDEEARRIDLHLHVGEHEPDRLVLDNGPAELNPLLRVIQGVLVRCPGDAHRL